MDVINCKEEQINWVDILYLMKCGFLLEHHTAFWLMFSESLSIAALMISKVDGLEQTVMMQ